MINATEIEAKALEFDIETSDVQRDYVFSWLICGIYSVSTFKDNLILKGGNAFRKAYFLTTRFSADLDFSTQGAIDSDALLAELNKVCEFVQANSGVVFDFTRNRIYDEQVIRQDRKVYKFRLYFKDFYGNADHITISVRVDVTQFDRIYLPVQTRQLIHPYSDVQDCRVELQCIKLEEALADKLKCLLQRRSSFDLFDLVYAVFFNNELAVDKREIVTTFLQKTIFEPSPITAKNLLLDLPFEFLRGFWDEFIVCPKPSRIAFDTAVTTFRDGLQSLFENFSYGDGRAMSFFPSRLRNPILQAGHDMTLLNITYDGLTRTVEPYSLVYKRRSDGYAQEYLYVYDRTGGHSGPGIKCMVNTKIANIENTEEKFEPRYEVEITKAGESGRKSYFARSFGTGPQRSRVRVSRRALSTALYTVQCSYCGKKFKRKRRSTRLNPHKDQYGNRCFGRVGHYV